MELPREVGRALVSPLEKVDGAWLLRDVRPVGNAKDLPAGPERVDNARIIRYSLRRFSEDSERLSSLRRPPKILLPVMVASAKAVFCATDRSGRSMSAFIRVAAIRLAAHVASALNPSSMDFPRKRE